MAKEWYILHIFSGYEKKIERAIRQLIDNNSIPPGVVSEIKIPEEELTEVKDGKKKVVRRKFLPGYILIEMDLPATNWKGVCAPIRRIHGVTGFLGVVGDARPQAISAEEAKSVLQKSGEIKGEKPRAAQIFAEGQQVKIIEGPFASFTGSVEEIMSERDKLRVMVPIFGRTTPVEVDMLQVELV